MTDKERSVLTPRQKEAWEWRRQGLIFKEIAAKMAIGTSAAHRLVRDARRRLGLPSRSDRWGIG